MRTMVDSTNIADEPTADLVAYYCDGLYAVSPAVVRARFPNAILVPISAIGTNCGVVGDVEPGCMSPAQAVQWARARRAAGVDPTAYVNDSNWAAVRAAFAAAGEPQPHYWEAHYDGNPALSPGTVAKQYANSAMTGGHFDRSSVADFWPGVDNTAGNAGRGAELVTTQAEFDALVSANPQLGGVGYAARLIFALGCSYAAGHPELTVSKTLTDLKAQIAALQPANAAALTLEQVQLLQEAHDAIQRVEAALKAA